MLKNVLRPTLELSVVMPAFLLAYLPVKSYLKQHWITVLAQMSLLTLGLSLVGGFVSYALNISTAFVLFFTIFLCIIAYEKSLSVSAWKSVSIALAICAVFSCVNSLSRAMNAIFTADLNITENELWFCLKAGVFYNLICWGFVLLAWYPATHSARNLVEDDNMAQTWYIFWILPLVFIGLNVFMVPKYRDTLYRGRIMQGYIVISLVLLALLVLFYAMFLMIANSLNQNAKLQQENQFLSMQQAQYDSLCITIEELRHARHDMRHHFTQLSLMAEKEDLENIKQYLSGAQNKIPNLNIHFSKNHAVDSVLGHYYTLAQRENIPFFAQIDLPETLPTDEMDMCLILSNLLENAWEASMRTEEQKRHIKVEVYMHLNHILLILVENTFDGELKETNGIFQSSKRKGNGIGIQSVRHMAEKSGGDSNFTYKDGIFTAKVMLRHERNT